MRTFLVTIGLALSMCVPVTLADDKSARAPEVILADYNAVQMPKFDQTKREDQAYVAQYIKDRNAVMEKRAEFAAELWKVAPDHPKAFELMQNRWMTQQGTGKGAVAAKEIDDALASATSEKMKIDMQYMKAMLMARGQDSTADATLAAAEDFIKAAPKDDRASSLLMMAAERYEDAPDKAVALYRRIVADYPASRATGAAKGKIRQVDGVGKPFELSFTEAITGKPMSIADLKGKVVVVDFWATWCGPCVAEMPHMKEIYAKYKDKGVQFVGVSLDQPEDKGGLTALKEFVAKNEIGWPQYYQGNYWQSEFSTSWGINSIPALFVVDQKGNLYSFNARGQVEALIEKLLNTTEKVGG